MKISVILCTFNRCQSLAATLQSLAGSALPDAVDWEVLVVDNNSTDLTRQVLDEFCRRYPGRFRYLFEPQPGKSFALNNGVRQARGEILAFLDDDVTVERTWLQNLTAPLNGKEWAGVGGRTLLAGVYCAPRWLAMKGPYSLGGILAAQFDLGDKARELDRAPYGVNMAFRKEMFGKYGLFRLDLGPSPNREIPRPNEDTEFGRRLMAGGERLWYEPSAIVYHPVPQDRVYKGYFLRWWFDLGRAFVREWESGPAVMGIPRPYFNVVKICTIVMAERLVRWLLSINPKQRFYNRCSLWMTAGQIREYWCLAHGAQGTTSESAAPRLES